MSQKARMAMRGRRMRLLRLAALQCASLAPQRSWPLGLAAVLSLGIAGCGGSSADGSNGANDAAAEQSSRTAVAGRSEVAQATATGTETWTRCAVEGEICRVPDTQLVRYGIDGAYVYKTVTNAIGCDNAQWSDPAFLRVKHCDYASSGAITPPAPAPAPAAWTFLANENEAFSVSGTGTVRYGAGGTWLQRTVSGSANCSNGYFGSDPAPNVVKRCELLGTSGTAPAPAPAPAPTATGWSFLANENQSFSLASASTVRYGLGSIWVQRSVTGSGTCSNAFFGTDPAPNQVKHCEVLGASSTVSAVGTAALGWSPASDPRVAGYRVYWGTAPGSYRQARGFGLAAGTATTYTVRDLPSGQTYYFAVTAYDGAGSESAFSAEASKTIP